MQPNIIIMNMDNLGLRFSKPRVMESSAALLIGDAVDGGASGVKVIKKGYAEKYAK